MGRMDSWVKSNWKKIVKREGIHLDEKLQENIERLMEKLKAVALEEKILEGIDMSNCTVEDAIESEPRKDTEQSNDGPKLVISVGSLPGLEETKEVEQQKKSWMEFSPMNSMNDVLDSEKVMDRSEERRVGK